MNIDAWVECTRPNFKRFETLHYGMVRDEDYKAIKMAIERAGGDASRFRSVAADGGQSHFWSTHPFAGSSPVPVADAIDILENAMESIPDGLSRPVNGSHEWKMPARKKKDIWKCLDMPGGEIEEKIQFLNECGVPGQWGLPSEVFTGDGLESGYYFSLFPHQLETLRLRLEFRQPGSLNVYPTDLEEIEELAKSAWGPCSFSSLGSETTSQEKKERIDDAAAEAIWDGTAELTNW